MKSPIAFVTGAGTVLMLFVGAQYSHRFPFVPLDDPSLTLLYVVAVLGLAAGWFLPDNLKALLTGALVPITPLIVVAGSWAIIAAIFAVVPLAIAVAGWFVGRVAVRAAGVDGHRANDLAGLATLVATLILPALFLAWEGRHVVGGAFPYTRQSDLWLEAQPLWKVTIGSRPDGSPVAIEGRVFATASGALHAINRDGTSAWTLPDVTTQPLWHDGALYAGVKTGLARIDHHSGVPIWIAAVPPAPGGHSGLRRTVMSVGATGTIYWNPGGRTIHAINADGTPRWTFTHDAGHFSGAPMEAGGRVFVASLRSFRVAVCAIDASGQLIWERRLPMTATTSASAGVGPDGTVYVAGWDYLFALGPDGSERWRRKFRGHVARPMTDPSGRVLADSSGWRVMTPEGRAVRHTATGGEPIFMRDLMLVPGSDIIAIDATGEEAFRLRISDEQRMDGNEAALAPDGMLYVQLGNSLVAIAMPNPPYPLKRR